MALCLRLANFTLAIQVVLGIIMYVMFLTQGRADVAAFYRQPRGTGDFGARWCRFRVCPSAKGQLLPR